MRCAPLIAGLLFLVGCASCGSHSAKAALLVPAQHLSPDAILAAAGPAAAGFRLEGGSLLHLATGLRCPAAIGPVNLVDLTPGAPGLASASGATCTYADAEGLKGFLTFRENVSTPPIEVSDCRDLPQRLSLDMGPPLPGISRFDPPAPSVFGSIMVGGKATPVQTCAWLREPFTMPIVISAVAGIQLGAWSIQATHTPPPPPCCAGYDKPMRPTFWFWEQELLQAAASP